MMEKERCHTTQPRKTGRHLNIKTTITELFICCLVDVLHCMFSKTKGLIGVR